MKIKKLILLGGITIISMLIVLITFGFVYEKNPNDTDKILEFMIKGHRGTTFLTDNISFFFEDMNIQRSAVSLENDNIPYVLKIPQGIDFQSEGISIIGNFENWLGKDFYLNYSFLSPLDFHAGKKYFKMTLEPDSFNFNIHNTACDRFNLKENCFFLGKLKKRILLVVSEKNNPYKIIIE